MSPLRAFRKTAAVLAVACACALGAAALPDEPYQRWQLLDGTIHAHARWIYERLHFDPTPVDVVFLGPSRVEAGVNAPLMREELLKRGLAEQVVNFSLPETGRNTNWAVARELFSTKAPKLIVLGVTEKPSRFGHAAFKYIAPAGAIADPGYLADFNYFSDLVYLPFRQLRLFAARFLPQEMGLTKTFDPARYLGAAIDTTGNVTLPDGRVKDGETPASAAELARGVHKLEAGMHPPLLPAAAADFEFGDERHYVRAIAELARRHGAKLAFLYLPYYQGPQRLEDVQDLAFYQSLGPVLNGGFLSPHAEWYADYGHLTRAGAQALTQWLAAPVAQLLEAPESKP